MAKAKGKGRARAKLGSSVKFSLLHVVRFVALVLLIGYVIGAIHLFKDVVGRVFATPLSRLIFLVLTILVGLNDRPLGLLMLAAFLVSMYTSARYSRTPLGRAVSYGQAATKQVINLPNDILNELPHLNGENMADLPTAQRSFEASERDGEAYMGKGADCNNISAPTTGCDPVVGYNAPFDCVCNGDCGGMCKKGNDCLCKGVATWKDELNAQGLNHPMGFPPQQEGATF